MGRLQAASQQVGSRPQHVASALVQTAVYWDYPQDRETASCLGGVEMSAKVIVVAGAGGFIGGHLVADLLRQCGARIRAVDCKPLETWWQRFAEADNRQLDLRQREPCLAALEGASEVYNLAADMGGMGFIENNRALCMLSVLINTHLLLAAVRHGVRRYFFASSACVYAADKQQSATVVALKEEDACPAMPEDGYGWEKLFSERMCRHFEEDFGLVARVARYHNVYGPRGTWTGGREKAPAAICRKVAEAKLSGRRDIEIWGDGSQKRSFTFIDDCIQGTQRIMHGNVREPLNLGSDELVSINELVDLVEDIAGIKLQRRYRPDAPKGVHGRNSDNTRIRALLGWAPSIRLRDGLEKTYAWVFEQVAAAQTTAVRSR
jgi:GDP-D-mannose 3',5'-epimerase